MTALVDTRPPGVDHLFRPGSTARLVAVWDEGDPLDGRVFSSTLDGVALAVDVEGQTVTVEATAAQTAEHDDGTVVEWLLLEDIDGTDEPVLVGRWASSLRAAESSTATVQVAYGTATVQVSVTSAQASTVALAGRVDTVEGDVTALAGTVDDHRNASPASGAEVHGAIALDWERDGWDAFTLVTMTADDPQVFGRTVEDGRGVITGTVAGFGNHREVYTINGTETWADSELESVIYSPRGPSGQWQQWHLHRVRERAPGQWEGVAIWTAVVGGGFDLLNCRAVRFDGTTLLQSTGDDATRADRDHLDRTLDIQSVNRFEAFGLWFADLYVAPRSILGTLGAGDLIDVDAVTDPSFDFSGIEVNQVNAATGVIQVIDPSSTTAVPRTAEMGTVRPVSDQKRWAPFRMATRVIGGTTDELVVEIRRSRSEERLPDWGDSRVMRQTILPHANVPELPVAAGAVALGGAHFRLDTSGSFGEVTARRV